MRSDIRTEPCACGGSISVAQPASDEEIVRAVWTHNNTVRHRKWRDNPDGPKHLDPYEGQLEIR